MLSPSDAWPVVQEAILAFRANVPDMAKARKALSGVLRQEAWRCYDAPTGTRCDYDEFAKWVRNPVPQGLHTTVENLEEIARGDTELTGLLDEALQRPVGTNQHSEGVNNINTRPQGTSQAQALRRLRKDAPELHAEVLAGHISPHAAMVKAGFRRRTGTVRYDDPDSAARTLRKHMPPEARRRLAELLTKED